MKKAYIPNQEIMDNWNYLLDYKSYVPPYSLEYRRTENAFCQNLCLNGKHVGCIYVFGLKKYEDGFVHGYIARVYINPKHRVNGLAIHMMSDIIKNFGDCVLHITSASPNRIEGLNNENREEYRKKLYRYYGHFGFERTSSIHTGMIRSSK